MEDIEKPAQWRHAPEPAVKFSLLFFQAVHCRLYVLLPKNASCGRTQGGRFPTKAEASFYTVSACCTAEIFRWATSSIKSYIGARS